VIWFNVILVGVTELAVGGPLNGAPGFIIATVLAVTIPVGVIALVAFVILIAGIFIGSETVLVFALNVVGVPVI